MGKLGTITATTLASIMLAGGIAFAVPQSRDLLLDNFAKHSTIYKTQVEENNKLNTDLKKTKADLETTEQELESTKADLKTTEQELTATQTQLTQKDTQLQDVTTLYNQSTQELELVNQTLASTTTELETTKTTLAEKENNIVTLNDEKSVLLSNITELDNEINNTTDQTTLENLSQKMTEMLNKFDDLNAQIVTLQNEIKNLNDTVSSLQAQIHTLENEKTQLSTQVGSLQMQITALEQDKIDLQTQVDNLQSQVNEKQTRIETLEHQIDEMSQYNAYVEKIINYYNITLVEEDNVVTGSYVASYNVLIKTGVQTSTVTSKSSSTTNNSIILKYITKPILQYTTLTENYDMSVTIDGQTSMITNKSNTFEVKSSTKYQVKELQNNLTFETADGQYLDTSILHQSYDLEFVFKDVSIDYDISGYPSVISGIVQSTLTMAELQEIMAMTTAMDNAVGTYSYTSGTTSSTLTINNDLTASLAVTINGASGTCSITQAKLTFVDGKLVISHASTALNYTITQIDDTSWSLSYSYTSGTAYPVGTINGILTKN